MTQENVELFHQAYDSVNRRDLDALVGLMAADVEAVPILSVFPDFTTEAVEVRDLGDVTLASLRVHRHGADSDAPLDAPLWLAARRRQGKCVRWGAYGTEGDALEAAGLRE